MIKRIVGNKIFRKTLEVACIVSLTTFVNSVFNDSSDLKLVDTQQAEQIQEIKEEIINNKNELLEILEKQTSTNNSELPETNKDKTFSNNYVNKEYNKKLNASGNVELEDNKKVIEITEETHNEIENGENSDLKGDVYIDKEDIISTTYKDYTEEDISNYKEYKQSLISEYGEDVYNLMNQEAGIKNEEESFLHYMKYGK